MAEEEIIAVQETTPDTSQSDWDVKLRRIRAIAGISALFGVAAGALVLVVMLLSLYPSLRTTMHNLERTSEAAAVSVESFAGVSDEAAQNLANSASNLNEATVNLNETMENFARDSLDAGLSQALMGLVEELEQRNDR